MLSNGNLSADVDAGRFECSGEGGAANAILMSNVSQSQKVLSVTSKRADYERYPGVGVDRRAPERPPDLFGPAAKRSARNRQRHLRADKARAAVRSVRDRGEID